MQALTRLRGYAGLWTLVGLLGLVLVFVAAAAGPVNRQMLDQALRQLIEEAPPPARDLEFTESTTAMESAVGSGPAESATQMHRDAQALLPPALADVVEQSWGAQRSQTQTPSEASPGLSASLAGPGVVTEPLGLHPLVTLHHQTELGSQVELVEGEQPATGQVRGVSDTVVEVMAAVEVAEAFGLRVGETYQLRFGVAPLPPDQTGSDPEALLIRVSGVFEPVDPAALTWQSDPRLLRPVPRTWPYFDDFVPLPMATLVTDQAGVDAAVELGLNPFLEFLNVARVRIDPQQLDQSWAPAGRDAVAEVLAHPNRRQSMNIQTRLAELIDEFERQSVAARAVTAVVAAGLVGTGVGLLLLAARLTVDRRRAELLLLRARGASLSRVVGRFLAEALVVVLPAAAVGWGLHRLLPGRPDPGVVLGIGALPLAMAVVALLAVPVAVVVGRRSGPGRRDLTRHRSAPARLTVEALVVLLAGLGVLLLNERGLTGTIAAARNPVAAAGSVATADPYLSAVPVLIGLAAGLVALRFYPWPLRLLGALAARSRHAVGFLGLTRAGRAAPATALPLLVLVLAVVLGGFAGAVFESVRAARDAAALRSVGADLRVAAERELTGPGVAEVAEVPGVTGVAGAVEDGFIRVDQRPVQAAAVLLLDAPAYQEVLAEIRAPGRLPESVVSAGPGTEPMPVLSSSLGPGQELAVELERVAYPAVVVGGTDDLPALHGARFWVLVPRQALPEPPPVTELLVSGTGVDPVAVRQAVAGAGGGDPDLLTVTTLAEQRAELERSGFNRALTLMFVVGTAGAAVGGLLAVGLALVVQAAARGRALSLLRTMGLSAGQARGILLVELVPVTALAVAVGAVAGTTMPLLLARSLGLAEFTGGAPLPIAVNPTTVGVLAGLLGVFVIGGALVEAAVNRRLGLGQVLRVD